MIESADATSTRPPRETGERQIHPPDDRSAERILRPGETCWRIARADRFAVIVDAADYFAAAKAAMLRAQRTIMLIGWDFDLRIRLAPDREDDVPDELDSFLKDLVRRKPGLEIFILRWDLAIARTLMRQLVPLALLDFVGHGRIHLRFDSTHPWTSAHHQKIAVIDDSLAFCGGIDMTDDRWDTRDHEPDNAYRVRPDGKAYGPWHDATAAVDGPAAKALGDLARMRWHFATGEHLDAPRLDRDPEADPWPDELVPDLRDVDVGIARTMPAFDGRAEILEIEKLYLAAIRAARHTIYLESQYFASQRICRALGERLKEPDGPEVIVVNPETAAGWLEEETMGAARDLCLSHIRREDRHGRFRIYYPVNAADEPIYVHAKILVIDDQLIRVGSSNINNRSMGFDSECDLAVEAKGERDTSTRRAILDRRNDLLAEHLGVSAADIAAAIDREGSLGAAIDSLRQTSGRSLRPLPTGKVNGAEALIVESQIADPERPQKSERHFVHRAKRLAFTTPALAVLAFGIGIAAGLAVARHGISAEAD